MKKLYGAGSIAQKLIKKHKRKKMPESTMLDNELKVVAAEYRVELAEVYSSFYDD